MFGDTLILNRSWMAIHIITGREAFRLLCNGSAKALDAKTFFTYDLSSWRKQSIEKNLEHNIDYIHHGGNRTKILIPRVMVLVRYNRLPDRIVKYSRGGVYDRDKYKCQYCGKRFTKRALRDDKTGRYKINIDHVIPRCDPRFPGTNFQNCVTSCVECNSKKGGRTPEQAGMKLIREPGIPRWRNLLHEKPVSHSSWKHFMVGECIEDIA